MEPPLTVQGAPAGQETRPAGRHPNEIAGRHRRRHRHRRHCPHRRRRHPDALVPEKVSRFLPRPEAPTGNICIDVYMVSLKASLKV